jgi:hypothetical protein
MRVQRFRALVAAAPRGRAVIDVPFDPDAAWGAKAEHPVGGTIGGKFVRGTIAPDDGRWAFMLSPMWLRDNGAAAGDDVVVELAPEGPQRADLADDSAVALAASPAAAAFFDTLAQFYRKAYHRWIDGTTRRPELRRRGSPRWSTCSRRGSSSGRELSRGAASHRAAVPARGCRTRVTWRRFVVREPNRTYRPGRVNERTRKPTTARGMLPAPPAEEGTTCASSDGCWPASAARP